MYFATIKKNKKSFGMKQIKTKPIVEHCVDARMSGADFMLLTSEEAPRYC